MKYIIYQNGISLKKQTLKRWIYEHNFTQPFVARRMKLSTDEFKRKLKEKEHFSRTQIRGLVELMGAESAFNVIYFSTLEEKRRVYQETFGKRNKKDMNSEANEKIIQP